MPESNPFIPLKNKIFILIFLFCLVIIAYSNTFYATWHLDDYSNIIQNDRMHLSDLHIDSITKALQSSPIAPHPQKNFCIDRPLSRLSLALNWYFFGDHVVSYHIFNLMIHLLTAFSLFLSVDKILKTPNLKTKYENSAFFIVCFSTALWALNPIQTQAITYIVQRMAAMAAMFYILSIYFFLNARTSNKWKSQGVYASACVLSYVLAFASKQNAVVLPLSLILIEIICFQDLSTPEKRKRILRLLLIVFSTVLFLLSVILFLLKKNPFEVMEIFTLRPFTLIERLLTQFRLLIYYLSQIFYPIPQRLSIDHDIMVSTSVLYPWTTLPSIILVVLLVIAGLLLVRKSPLFSLAILFYFLNHLVESSILPLELMFEHRNYLPSFFIFLPVAAGLKYLLDRYRHYNRAIYILISLFILFLPLFFASGTYIRNMAWKTENSLWTDALEKAPKSARSAYNLANVYFKRVDGLETAEALYQKSFDLIPALSPAIPAEAKALTLNGIAGINYIKKDYEKAAFYSRKAVGIAPDSEIVRHSLVLSLFEIKKFDEALENIDILIFNNNRNVRFLQLKSIALIKLGKPEQALVCLRQAMQIQPGNARILLHIGEAYSLSGNIKKAEWFFLRASRLSAKTIEVWLSLIEVSIRSGNDTQVKKYLAQLFSHFTVDQVYNYLSNNTSLSIATLMVETQILTPVITDYLETAAMEFYTPSD